jgi:hypothetical protein
MRSRWQALRAEMGSAGLALSYVAGRLLQRVSSGRAAIVPYLIVAQPIGLATATPLRPDANTVVRRITPDDPVTADFPRPADVVAARFAAGAECHVAWVRGRFAGHIWIARGHYDEDEVRGRFVLADPATCVWDFDVYVEPALRLGRTMARLWRAVDDTLAAEGVRWSLSRINRFNAASVRSHARLGIVPLGTLTVVCLGTGQWHRCRGGGVEASPAKGRRSRFKLLLSVPHTA